MKKKTLPPGIEDVIRRLMECRNFRPNPMFRMSGKRVTSVRKAMERGDKA